MNTRRLNPVVRGLPRFIGSGIRGGCTYCVGPGKKVRGAIPYTEFHPLGSAEPSEDPCRRPPSRSRP